PAALAAALRRALDARGSERETMGAAAAAAVRRVCDSQQVVRRHLVLKRRLAEAAATSVARAGLEPSPGGIGLVVSSLSHPDAPLDSCMAAILLQSEAPVSVYFVCENASVAAAKAAAEAGWRVTLRGRRSAGEAERDAAQHLLAEGAGALGVAFVD